MLKIRKSTQTCAPSRLVELSPKEETISWLRVTADIPSLFISGPRGVWGGWEYS